MYHTGTRPILAKDHFSPVHCCVIISIHKIIYKKSVNRSLARIDRMSVCFQLFSLKFKIMLNTGNNERFQEKGGADDCLSTDSAKDLYVN